MQLPLEQLLALSLLLRSLLNKNTIDRIFSINIQIQPLDLKLMNILEP